MYVCSRVNGVDEDMDKHNGHFLRACVCARDCSKVPSVGMAPAWSLIQDNGLDLQT